MQRPAVAGNQPSPPISPIEGWLALRTGLGSGLSPESLRQYQLGRLIELLDYVQSKSAYYRHKLAGLNPLDLNSLDDLASLPLMTAADLIDHGDDMVCLPQSRVARIITVATSGTSGRPKRLYFSEPDLELCLDFFAHGMRTMAEPGDLVEICLPGHNQDGVVDLLAKAVKRFGVAAKQRDPGAASAAPTGDCLVGMAAHIYQLAQSYPRARPKSVLLCADYVPEAVIEALREIWNTEVFTHYGSTESGQGGGVECSAHDGYHPRWADLLIEIIDPRTGQPLPSGQTGEIVLTTLTRQAQPLIRYRTGDLAGLIDRPCACGSRLPRLGKVAGRFDNSLHLKSGALISIHQLDEIMFRFKGVLDYQAELSPDLGGLRLLVRPHLAGPDPEMVIGPIRARIDPTLAVSLELDFDLRMPVAAKRVIRLRPSL